MTLSERKFEVPSFKDFCIFMLYGGLLFGFFAFVYGLTNHRSAVMEPHHLYADWETGIPLIPSMIVIYFSLNLLTTSTLFFLKGREIHYLALTYFLSMIIGGSFFYFFPTTAGFERAEAEPLGRIGIHFCILGMGLSICFHPCTSPLRALVFFVSRKKFPQMLDAFFILAFFDLPIGGLNSPAPHHRHHRRISSRKNVREHFLSSVCG